MFTLMVSKLEYIYNWQVLYPFKSKFSPQWISTGVSHCIALSAVVFISLLSFSLRSSFSRVTIKSSAFSIV